MANVDLVLGEFGTIETGNLLLGDSPPTGNGPKVKIWIRYQGAWIPVVIATPNTSGTDLKVKIRVGTEWHQVIPDDPPAGAVVKLQVRTLIEWAQLISTV
jgi:hypothetical protein